MKHAPKPPEKLQRQSVWAWIYDRLAGLYDSVDWFTLNATHRYRRKLLPLLPEPGARILEIGVGTGKLHHDLATEYEVLGIDRAWGMLKRSQRKLRRMDQLPRLTRADGEYLPFRDAVYDAIVSTFVFSAIPDLEALLHDCDRVLRPGGVLLIIDAGRADDGNGFASLLARSWELLGDYIRDERPILRQLGFSITYQEFAPKGCVHLVCARKPDRS